MSARKRTLVLGLLLVLLAAAVANFLFVFHAYNNTMKRQEALLAGNGGMSGLAPSAAEAAADDGQRRLHMVPGVPPWYGELRLAQAPSGGYDLTLTAGTTGVYAPISLTSFEADIRHPGDSTAAFTPIFQNIEPGRWVAHVDFPEPGSWEVRMRMHRDLQTVEFTQKFTTH